MLGQGLTTTCAFLPQTATQLVQTRSALESTRNNNEEQATLLQQLNSSVEDLTRQLAESVASHTAAQVRGARQ